MAVYDALIVLAWVAVNVLYVQQRVSLILPIFKSAKFLTSTLHVVASALKSFAPTCTHRSLHRHAMSVTFFASVVQSLWSRDYFRTWASRRH